MTVWVLAIVGNAFLAILLLWHKHYIRYPYLFGSLVFAVLADPILFFGYSHDRAHYSLLYHAVQTILMLFNFAIIFEAWRHHNLCVRRPLEIFLACKLIAFIAEKHDYPILFREIQNTLRIGNLLLLVFWCYCFRKEARYDRTN